MKVKETTSSRQGNTYAAPEIYTVDIANEGILCFSTENLIEDTNDPWALI